MSKHVASFIAISLLALSSVALAQQYMVTDLGNFTPWRISETGVIAGSSIVDQNQVGAVWVDGTVTIFPNTFWASVANGTYAVGARGLPLPNGGVVGRHGHIGPHLVDR